MIRCEGWESPCVDTASERGEGGLEWDRRVQNFQFFHDYHDHRVGAKALLWHDNKVLTLNLLLGFTVAFHSFHDGNDDTSTFDIFILLLDWCLCSYLMKCGPRREGREPVVQPDTFQVQPFFSDSVFFLSTIFLTSKSKSRRTKIQNNDQMSFDSPSPSIRSIRSIRIQHRMSVLQVFIPFGTFAHHHHTWLHWLQWLQIHFQKSDHPPLPILEPGRQIWWKCGKRILRGAE